MTTKRRYWIAATGALALLAAACGGAEGAESSATTASETTPTTVAVTPTTQAVEPSDVGPADGVPSGMPTEYGGPIMVLAFRPEQVAGGHALTLRGSVTADDGTAAELRIDLFDFRTEGGSVECGGETHVGPYTAANDEVSVGHISIDGWGAAELRIDNTTHAFEAEHGAPFCDEQTGIWTGTEGELEGRSGAFHRLMVDGEESISLS